MKHLLWAAPTFLATMLLSGVALADSSSFIQQMPTDSQVSTTASKPLHITTIVKTAYVQQWQTVQQKYRNLRVKTIYNAHGLPDHLIVFKNQKTTKGFTIDRIALANNALTENVMLTPQDLKQLDVTTTPQCPDNQVTFVVSSYNYSDPDRKIFSSPAVDQIAQEATQAGYHVKELFDKDATTQNMLNYLSCPNVKAYHDTGDGYPYYIETYDGILSVDDINKNLAHKLQNKTIYLNDCMVASKVDNSIEKTIINNGAQAFIGGITPLGVLTTDAAGACFWHQAMQGKNMQQASAFCQSQYDYTGVQNGETDYQSNGNDLLAGIQTHLPAKVWGSISTADHSSNTIYGVSLNNQSSSDEQAANTAEQAALSSCTGKGGTNCGVATKNNPNAQFQNCSAFATGSSASYFGFGISTNIASTQALEICKDLNSDQPCTLVWQQCQS